MGAAKFSNAFRLSLRAYEKDLEKDVLDKGEVKVPSLGPDQGRHKKLHYLADYSRMVIVGRRKFASLFDRSKFPIIVGGDCGMILATLPTLMKAYPNLNLIWFDAHGDYNTPETSPSSFIGGMLLALATGLFELPGLESESFIASDRVALLATRDLDPGEKRNIKTSSLFHRTYRRGRLVRDVDTFLNRTDGEVMVHLDVDALDPSVIPAVNFPVPNGPSIDEVLQSMLLVKESGRLCAIEVASLDVLKDHESNSTRQIAQLTGTLLS